MGKEKAGDGCIFNAKNTAELFSFFLSFSGYLSILSVDFYRRNPKRKETSRKHPKQG
jgi:hypothetical protein